MADVSAISVISSAAVGALGVAAAAAGHLVSLRNEKEKRREARREDLRSVLDDAAKAGTEVMRIDRLEPTIIDASGLATWAEDLARAQSVVEQCTARIGVRVGTDAPVFSEYVYFSAATRSLQASVATMVAQGLFPSRAKAEARSRLKPDSNLEMEMRTAESQVEARLSAFLNEAKKLAGLGVA